MVTTEGTMRTLATSIGMGGAALDFIREDPARLTAFRQWADGKVGIPDDVRIELAVECAALTCAGLHHLFRDAA
jgi:hypothetical protein